MKNKTNLVFIAIIALFIAITGLYFTYEIVVTYDSSHYLWLTSLLSSNGDFSTWDVARGPIFPGFIKFCNLLFGQNSMAIVAGTFIFYIIMILFCYLIYKDTIKEEISSKKVKLVIMFLFFVLVIINPIIMGYYHALLTEFFAITLSVVGCYLAWKWMDIGFMKNKVKYILFTLLFAVLITISWLLKQPYVSTTLFPVIIATILSIIRNIKFTNFIQRGITILVCFIVLFGSLKIWNFVLVTNNVELKEERTSGGFFASGLILGLSDFSNDEKPENCTTAEAVSYILEQTFKNPGRVISSYFADYLATCAIYDFDQTTSIINKKFDLSKNTVEISAIGFRPFVYGIDNTFYLSEELSPYADPYRQTNKPLLIGNLLLKNLEDPMVIIMKISYLLLPILLVSSIITVFVIRKKYQEKYRKIVDLITILFGYSFLHIMMHAVLGATIDRYSVPAMITTYIGIILGVFAIVCRKKYKNIEKKEEGK